MSGILRFLLTAFLLLLNAQKSVQFGATNGAASLLFTRPRPPTSSFGLSSGPSPEHRSRFPAAPCFYAPLHRLSSPRKQSSSSSSSSLSSSFASSSSSSPLPKLVLSGLLGGGFHAIAGPDHLAALLPRCLSKRWLSASKVGLQWGLGHGLTATLLGSFAFFFKTSLGKTAQVQRFVNSYPGIFKGGRAASLLDAAVGLSLVTIGLLGVREASEWTPAVEHKSGEEEDGTAASTAAAACPKSSSSIGINRFFAPVFLNGLLHGLSPDGAVGLSPSLALSSYRLCLSFLLSYSLGTALAMAVAAAAVGETTCRLGGLWPDAPKKMAKYSAFAAIAVGAWWMAMALR